MLAQHIAAGYMVEKGKSNTVLESAALLGYDDVERAMLSAPATNAHVRENKPGSFERLMGFAGGMQKR